MSKGTKNIRFNQRAFIFTGEIGMTKINEIVIENRKYDRIQLTVKIINRQYVGKILIYLLI